MRKKRDDGPRALPPEWVKTAAGLFVKKQTPNFKKAHRDLEKECILRGLEPPSYSWTVRWIKRALPKPTIDYKRSVKKYREDWRVKYEPCVLREKHDVLRDIADGDWHKLDIEIIDDEGVKGGKPYRPFLCAIGDCCSDEILGLHLQHVGNALGIGSALRHAILPKRHPTTNQIDPKVPNACAGTFKQFYTDQGKDFTSTYVRTVIHDLGGSVRECEGYHGQSKPIERWFKTLNELISELPGYIGRKKDERRWNTKPTLTRKDLFAKIYEWTFYEYHNRETKALKGLSPYGVLKQRVDAGFNPVVPDERALDMLLMPSRGVTIHKWGIELFGTSTRRNIYWSDEFAKQQLIGQRATCRYKPDDLGEVLVYIDGRFICIAKSEQRRGYREKDLKDLYHRRKLSRQAVEQRINEVMAKAQYPDDLERVKAERVYGEIWAEELKERAAGASSASVPLVLPKYGRTIKLLGKKSLREKARVVLSEVKPKTAAVPVQGGQSPEKPEWLTEMEREEQEALKRAGDFKVKRNPWLEEDP
ncbi:MAG: Mu transposase C-terminal domain-containing protein [Deltaproteobacteria bacterium]|nr:Mu transposase C-terminal domain-containing protein [Deltaproteobacteria bacterium]